MTIIETRPPQSPPPPPPTPPRSRIKLGGFRPRPSHSRVSAMPLVPETPLRRAVRAGLLALTLLMAWLLFYALLLTPLQNHHDQGVLYSRIREQIADETAPLGGALTAGIPIGIMDAPAAGIKREVIVEGTTSSNLAEGPGHLRSTPLPGQFGLSEILGRARLFGAPFRSIASLPVGATITFTTAEGKSTYKVLDVQRAGQLGPAPIPPGGGGLLLVTADSSGWRSGWAPTNVVYVDAVLTSAPYGTQDGGLTPQPNQSAESAVPIAERPLKGDVNSLYVLVLWLPLLLGAVLLTGWGYARWGRWQAWVCGVPLMLGALWGVSKVAIQLLPNLT